MAIDVLRQRKVPTKKIFDKMFFSNQMHLAKPDALAFQEVLKKLKVKPSEALMVDDRAENIQAAKALGMRGIVYKDAASFAKQIKKYELVQK